MPVDISSDKPVFSIEELTDKLQQIRDMGWIRSHRPGNQGAAGNTLEDLLGVKENNFQAPDYGEYELKTHRRGSNYITLFHREPVNFAFIKNLLPAFGWKHKTRDEWRISITTSGLISTNRGFRAKVDRQNRRVYVGFDIDQAKNTAALKEWLDRVRRLQPSSNDTLWATIEAAPDPTSVVVWEEPTWPFDLLEEILTHKIYNTVVVETDVRKAADGVEEYNYRSAKIYRKISLDRFLGYIEQGYIYIDFDARTKHNHGIKYRVKPHLMVPLYESEEVLM